MMLRDSSDYSLDYQGPVTAVRRLAWIGGKRWWPFSTQLDRRPMALPL
jgi:hypothetical protein